jgi:glycerol uptake facilitator-like aquaporin
VIGSAYHLGGEGSICSLVYVGLIDESTTQAHFYISCAFGFSLFAIASIFYRFTGSIFNPSVSLALCLIGAIKPMRFVSESTCSLVRDASGAISSQSSR